MSVISTFSDLQTALLGGTGSHTLANNITVTADLNPFQASSTFTLDGNGYIINGNGYRLFTNNSNINVDVNLYNLSIINGRNTSGNGGAIYLTLDTTLHLSAVNISACATSGHGGAIYIDSQNNPGISAVNCSFVACSAFSTASSASSAVDINLRTYGNGGALALGNSNYLSDNIFVNCTIGNNYSLAAAGVYIKPSGRLGTVNAKYKFYNCTIVGNSATDAYGGVFTNSSYYSYNTMLANNNVSGSNVYAGSDIGGTAYELVIDHSCITNDQFLWAPYDSGTAYDLSAVPTVDSVLSYTSNIIDTVPLLSNLTLVSGAYIFPVCADSITIDKGNPVEFDTIAQSYYTAKDQRGSVRIQGSIIDIGAYEYGGMIITSLSPNYSLSGTLVRLMGRNFTPSPTTISVYLSGGLLSPTSYSYNFRSPTEVIFNIPAVTPLGNPGYNVYLIDQNNTQSNIVNLVVIPSNRGGPVIKFTNPFPDDRWIQNDGNVTEGSIHVTISDPTPYGSITLDDPFTKASLLNTFGEIRNLNQITSASIEFDVERLFSYGTINLSARDDYNRYSSATDGPWFYTLDSDKKINLTNFLPTHLYDSDIFTFIKFFEDFLNTLYEDKDELKNDSILRKIEKIADFNDPTAIDLEYISFFAKKLGYSVNLNRNEIGLFLTSGASTYEELTPDELEVANQYLRFVVTNLPNWYKIKTTENAVKVMLYSYGIIGQLSSLFTNDYNNNWVSKESIPLKANYYPTPHFNILIDLESSNYDWLNNLDSVINAIDSIRPINTVFEKINGYYRFQTPNITLGYGNAKIGQFVFIPWQGAAASLS